MQMTESSLNVKYKAEVIFANWTMQMLKLTLNLDDILLLILVIHYGLHITTLFMFKHTNSN